MKQQKKDEDEFFEDIEDGESIKMGKATMKDLNEQDLEDLREIKMLEKIANIRQSQGITEDHADFEDEYTEQLKL